MSKPDREDAENANYRACVKESGDEVIKTFPVPIDMTALEMTCKGTNERFGAFLACLSEAFDCNSVATEEEPAGTPRRASD